MFSTNGKLETMTYFSSTNYYPQKTIIFPYTLSIYHTVNLFCWIRINSLAPDIGSVPLCITGQDAYVTITG